MKQSDVEDSHRLRRKRRRAEEEGKGVKTRTEEEGEKAEGEDGVGRNGGEDIKKNEVEESIPTDQTIQAPP